MRRAIFRIVISAIAAMLFSSVVLPQNEEPSLVVIPGTIQSNLGCEGDWQPDCEATALTFDEVDDLWSATFTLPAGEYEYKVALNGSWDVNYGLGGEAGGANIALVLEEETDVRFFYDHDTNYITDSVNSIVANVPGSYQSELGCPEDWMPACLQSMLQDPEGDGIYTFSTSAIPAGFYEAKVAYNESWTLNYGDGGAQNGANIGFTVPDDGSETVFTYDVSTNVMTITVGGETGPAIGNLFVSKAVWVTADTLAWDISRIPGAEYRLHFSPDASLSLTDVGVEGGDFVTLTVDREGLPGTALATSPQLLDYVALKIAPEDLARVPEILTGQVAISVTFNNGTQLGDATGVQTWGAIDDLYAYDGPLGVTFTDGVPQIAVWAPTAQNVRLHLFADSAADTEAEILDMTHDAEAGVWSVSGDAAWYGQYYLYEVTVFSPASRTVVTHLVTDPYSVSLSANSTRSQIIDLNDPALFPEGWAERNRPALAAPEDIVLYELHVRDFSIADMTVPEAERGTFAAFNEPESDGMRHLTELADAGLTHVHLLPVFDIATINENAAERTEIDRDALAALPPDSEEQQALIDPIRDLDGFNWGYDPYHFTAPEGSYSTQPDGIQRIVEFREMVMGLNNAGLRVVMDVVYNHTNASGEDARAVFDRIVPGYYHRLNADGRVETSTCCQNTATERTMMERFMVDSLRTWTTAYGVEGYRFDLMGHHMVDNMLAVREMLDGLTLDADGVDGPSVYVYGEGWNFGEVADNARGVNATQLNMAGTGIGTFSDRLRDAVRGGNPFGGWQEQGFANGLFTFANEVEVRTADEQSERLFLFMDQIRLGLAGNLAEYPVVTASGEVIPGEDVDYNGQPAGYTLDPQEHIVYASAHDNETIFDATQLKAPLAADMDLRVRMVNMANSIVMFSQGVPFFTAGDELLRSKSLDRNSYNSGDWYNAIDWTMTDNNWGHGLPPAADNEDNWPIMQPLLANPDLAATPEQIALANSVFRELLQIRRDHPLFRLQTAEDVINRVSFLNTGSEQIPGVIVMVLDDSTGENLDPVAQRIVVVFNASPETQSIDISSFGAEMLLHPVQAESADVVVRDAAFVDGTLSVPGFTTAVFFQPE